MWNRIQDLIGRITSKFNSPKVDANFCRMKSAQHKQLAAHHKRMARYYSTMGRRIQ